MAEKSNSTRLDCYNQLWVPASALLWANRERGAAATASARVAVVIFAPPSRPPAWMFHKSRRRVYAPPLPRPRGCPIGTMATHVAALTHGDFCACVKSLTKRSGSGSNRIRSRHANKFAGVAHYSAGSAISAISHTARQRQRSPPRQGRRQGCWSECSF
jgi:hypothetical protein